MGKQNGPYNADFPEGSRVQIVERVTLEGFRDHWRLHHPIQPEQLEYAGAESNVTSVGYYHGADELYQLK